VARGGGPVVCLTGDGGIQLNIQELQTVVNYRLPIKIFVMNNGGYVSIKNTQKAFFQGRLVGCDSGSGLGLPQMRKIARAYGIATARIGNQRNLAARIRRVLRRPGAVLCEVLLQPDARLLPRVGSRLLPNGQMVSSPLEELSPPLPPAELAAHLFIAPWREEESAPPAAPLPRRKETRA
jgi:acetolactate synthase-1/2/3 large subunit